MCGIIGLFNCLEEEVSKGLDIIKSRGLDNKKIISKDNLIMGHRLHAMINYLEQPLIGKGIFVSNCEIYNWQELNKKYKLNAKNDSDVIFKLLEQDINIQKILDELDGVYAFAYYKNNKLILVRDILGIKPLFYDRLTHNFASEKKVLINLGCKKIEELNPRRILIKNNNEIKFIERDFYSNKPEHKEKYEILKNNTKELFIDSIKKRLPDKKIKLGLLFSGGIDSTLIAKILKNLNIDFTCYTAGFFEENTKEPEDIIYAKKIAKELDLKLKIKFIKRDEVEQLIKKVVPLIEDSNVVKVGVALPFFVACEIAKKDNVKVIFSGLGSEEIFAGYQRHKEALDINKECLIGLKMMYERDLYRDDVVTMNNNIELRLPFLDKKLVNYTLKIPSKYKIKNDVDKFIIRDISYELGLPKYIAYRKKKAAQYGSRFDSAIKKLAGKKSKANYLNKFLKKPNLKLGVLFSSGKDSCYALHIMMKQKYEIKCLITLKSINKESYMFHTPNINLTEIQAKAINLPIIIQETLGEKEKELIDLEKVLVKAKTKYNIDGIITGALYSTYQRDRIEKIADKLQLKVFSPLWHINQENEMRQLINENFKIILSSVAADGLNKNWLGKIITHKEIDKLVKLNEKLGLNIAGEGGEYESFVLDAPFFKQKIEIIDYEIKEVSENEAYFIINEIKLVDK
jgi:diphthine-ammonia ligase